MLTSSFFGWSQIVWGMLGITIQDVISLRSMTTLPGDGRTTADCEADQEIAMRILIDQLLDGKIKRPQNDLITFLAVKHVCCRESSLYSSTEGLIYSSFVAAIRLYRSRRRHPDYLEYVYLQHRE